MQKFYYGDQKYDGVLIHPIDNNSNDDTPQKKEFAFIVMKTLTDNIKLKLSPKLKLSTNNIKYYRILKNKDKSYRTEISSIHGNVKLLCKFVPIYLPNFKRNYQLE